MSICTIMFTSDEFWVFHGDDVIVLYTPEHTLKISLVDLGEFGT